MNEPKSATPDLEKLRDERCFPIVREVLKDMAKDLMPDDANEKVDYNPMIFNIMKRNLESDLNIAVETPYIFQLILGVLQGLNKTVQGCSTVLIDDVRYGRIGKEILQVIADSNVKLGAVTPEEQDADFVPIKEKINEIFKREQLSMLEVKYIMDNIFAGFDTVQNGFNQTLENSSRLAEAKLFGIKDMSDLTVKKLDDVLRSVPFPKDL